MQTEPTQDETAIRIAGRLAHYAIEARGQEAAELLIRELGSIVLDGERTLAKLATALDCEYQELYRVLRRCGAYEPRRHHSKLTDEQSDKINALLLDSELTRREIAGIVGVSKGSVDRRALEMRREALTEASDEADFVEEVWKCPRHGLVCYRPCVACEALRKAGR